MIDRILPNMPHSGLGLIDLDPRAEALEPELLLAAAVLQQAAQDWRALARAGARWSDRATIYELRLFFGGEWFVLYCDALGLDADYVHRAICGVPLRKAERMKAEG